MSKAARRKTPRSGRAQIAKAVVATFEGMGATLKRVESVASDPDFPVKRRTVSFVMTFGAKKPEPINADELAAFEAALSSHNIPDRIQNAQQRLPQIVGYPEHDEAAALLKKAEDFGRDAQNQSLSWAHRNNAGDKAHDALDRFADKMRDGLKRAFVRRREETRQAWVRKSRGSRMPELDIWLDEALRAKPRATDKTLWKALPTEDDLAKVYRDGDNVVETNRKGVDHSIGSAGFDKRVTAARQRRNAVSK